MEYRLAALPRGWVDAEVFILEDRIGRLYQFNPGLDHLERLQPSDANMLMQWYELSQTFAWHRREELVQMLTSPTRRRDRLAGGAVSLR